MIVVDALGGWSVYVPGDGSVVYSIGRGSAPGAQRVADIDYHLRMCAKNGAPQRHVDALLDARLDLLEASTE